GDVPYTLLVVASQRPGGKVEVMSGYRLFGTVPELEGFASSASAAFQHLLTRFGLLIRVGVQEGILIVGGSVAMHPDLAIPIVEVVGDQPESVAIVALVRQASPSEMKVP